MATSITQWIIRLTGLAQVVLGVMFWHRRALELIHVHMMIGMTFVIALLVAIGLARAWVTGLPRPSEREMRVGGRPRT